MKFPFDELNMRDGEHVEWVKSHRDPELWHAAAIAVVNYLGDPHGFLVWLFDQPETDRATAGYIFLGAYGSRYLRGQTDFGGEGLSDEQWLGAMTAICRRAATTGFANDSLGLHPGFESERQACLELINRGEVLFGRGFYQQFRPTFLLSDAETATAEYRSYRDAHDHVADSGVG